MAPLLTTVSDITLALVLWYVFVNFGLSLSNSLSNVIPSLVPYFRILIFCMLEVLKLQC